MSNLYVDSIVEKTTGNGVHIPGHVIQLVNADLGYATVTSTTKVDIGSATITPKFTTSKILIIFEQHIYVGNLSSDLWRGALVRLRRGSTTLLEDESGEYGESFYLQSDADRYMTYSTRTYVDTPNTTSATTYTISGGCKGTTTVQYNNSINQSNYGAGGRIILQEIAQ